MSIWFVLWVLLSLALLYFMGWTLLILFKQKKAWRAYAKKHKLRYISRQLLGTPEISGAMGDYTINMFPSEHISPDARGSRKLTAIEIQLSTMLPVEAGVANGGMVEVVQGFGFKEEMRPDHKDWDKSYIASADSKAVLDEYLTKERLDALLSLMKVDNSWVILVFRGETALLRFDTPDPLPLPKKIDALTKQMLKAAAALELKDGESGRLKAKKARKRQKEAAIEVDEDALDTGLSLEEDGAPDDDQGEEKPST